MTVPPSGTVSSAACSGAPRAQLWLPGPGTAAALPLAPPAGTLRGQNVPLVTGQPHWAPQAQTTPPAWSSTAGRCDMAIAGGAGMSEYDLVIELQQSCFPVHAVRALQAENRPALRGCGDGNSPCTPAHLPSVHICL